MKNKFLYVMFIWAALFNGACSDDDKVESGATFEVSEGSLRFGSLAAEQVVKISASQPWKITGIPEWLSVIPAAGDAGEFEVKIAALDNTNEEERKVRLVVESGGDSWNLTVYQLEKGVLEIDKKEFVALYNNSSITVPYRANGILEISFSEGADWISAPKTKVVTDQKLVFGLTENTSGIIRQTDVYLNDPQSGLKDTLYVTQYPKAAWKLNGDKLFAKYNTIELASEFECNVPFDVTFEDSTVTWVKLKEKKLEDGKFKMIFTLTENAGEAFNRVNLTLNNELLGLSFPMSLSQMYKTYDGHTVIWKKPTYRDPFGEAGATLGKLTFNFILIGDGFTKEEIETGVYDQYCQEAMEGMESLEPFKTYSERFGFILLHAESPESGCTDKSSTHGGPITVNTRFKCAYDEFGTGMSCDFDAITNFVTESLKNEGEEYVATKDVVIVVANGKRYGGVANLTKSGIGVAICPASQEAFPNNFVQIVRHEAGGHAFGKLADEYSFGGPIDQSTASYLKSWQDAGMYLNVSMSSTEFPAPWQELKDAGKLSNAYVGGFSCSGGVWRSSENSLMKGMDEGFNILSRYLIYLRMKNIRGEGMDFPNASVGDFLKRDKADK